MKLLTIFVAVVVLACGCATPPTWQDSMARTGAMLQGYANGVRQASPRTRTVDCTTIQVAPNQWESTCR
jgi:hypothetical protein